MLLRVYQELRMKSIHGWEFTGYSQQQQNYFASGMRRIAPLSICTYIPLVKTPKRKKSSIPTTPPGPLIDLSPSSFDPNVSTSRHTEIGRVPDLIDLTDDVHSSQERVIQLGIDDEDEIPIKIEKVKDDYYICVY